MKKHTVAIRKEQTSSKSALPADHIYINAI